MAFGLTPVVDNVHILGNCGGLHSDPCVTHADGSLVTVLSPARPNEVVVIYAFGLGTTDPVVPTGQAAATASMAVSGVGVRFNFRSNAGPTRPYSQLETGLRPEFAGLTPGQIGLYQINVRLPDVFPDVSPYDSSSGALWSHADLGARPQVLSNLTIDVSTSYLSFDAVGICVQPQ